MPVSVTEISTATISLPGANSDSSSLWGELHCVGKKIEQNLFDLRSSPTKSPSRSSTVTSRLMPCFVARSRTKVRALSMAKGRSNVASSSSMRPASTLERSRISLMRDKRWRPERGYHRYTQLVSRLARRTSSPQDLREADDGIKRCSELMGHVGEEF